MEISKSSGGRRKTGSLGENAGQEDQIPRGREAQKGNQSREGPFPWTTCRDRGRPCLCWPQSWRTAGGEVPKALFPPSRLCLTAFFVNRWHCGICGHDAADLPEPSSSMLPRLICLEVRAKAYKLIQSAVAFPCPFQISLSYPGRYC